MAIAFHERTGEFHLYNREISYIMKLLPDGSVGQLYYGKRLRDREDYGHMLEYAVRDMAPCPFENDNTFSREHVRQEYPVYGTGDMRCPAYRITCHNGSRVTGFAYTGHRIYEGKKPLEGLPAVYVENDREACSLELYLEDRLIHTRLVLTYTVYRDFPVIARHARFECMEGCEGIRLDQAMSLSLDLPDSCYTMLDLAGAWGRKRYPDFHPLHQGIQSVHSMRGHSSHQFNPFLALMRPGTGETAGEVIAAALVYSGNFLASAEVDTMGTTRVMIGIHPEGFSWPLAAGEHLQTPEALLIYSDKGLNGMSQVFHRLFRTRLARGWWRDRERPILINNWEATYMNFNEEKILTLAEKAKEVGVELFVLDDGWFGNRDDDTSSLGDWYADRKKLPDGIEGLSQKIRNMGLSFGLWFEPEMINQNSRLYDAHPDWVLGSGDRPRSVGRHQLVLDFSKDEVIDYIGGLMEDIIERGHLSYIKWDMNRSITEVWSSGRGAAEQGTILHRQILGVYRLYERLIRKFPYVLFESCASGGARFDPGMLYYAPQAWTSDNTDGVERIKIQYGTSYVYPLSSMGSHVSAAPNHQTHRSVPLAARAVCAYFGTFGYEMDVAGIGGDELEQMKKQTAFMKEHRRLIAEGTFYRLISPFENERNEAGWMVVSPDKREALAAYFRVLQPVNTGFCRMRLSGLLEDGEYEIREQGLETLPYTYYGDELMNSGLILSDQASGVRSAGVPQGDYLARLFILNVRDGRDGRR